MQAERADCQRRDPGMAALPGRHDRFGQVDLALVRQSATEERVQSVGPVQGKSGDVPIGSSLEHPLATAGDLDLVSGTTPMRISIY